MNDIEQQMSAPDFWTNQERAQELLQQVKAHRGWLDPFDRLRARSVSAADKTVSVGRRPPGPVDRLTRLPVGGAVKRQLTESAAGSSSASRASSRG